MAPPFHLLLHLVDEMYRWLKADPENVVVIHCNSGKGRAGTSCCCLLLYSGFFDNIYDCARLFGARRFDTNNKMGISQPCQVRFIHYFEAFYKGIVKSPQIKYLKKITIFSVPNTAGTFGNIGCKPYFEIYRVLGVHNELIYSNKDNKDQVRFYSRDDGFIQLDLDNLPLFGNILVQFKTVGSISNSNLFRTTFNTAFIGRNNLFEVNRRCISPEDLHKDTYTFAEDFFVRFTFEDYCKGEAGTNERRPCRSVETPLNEICDNCTSIMKEEIQHWREAQEILANHDRPSVETAR